MSSESSDILSRQQEMIAMIFDLQPVASRGASNKLQQGLKIYRNNLLMTAARALSLSYPVLEKMLGHEAMVAMARELLAYSPPQAGDWAEWGGELSGWIAASPLVSEYPYLPDVAQLEWRMHQASRGPETRLDTASLSRLSDDSLDAVYLELPSTLKLLSSPFPVDVLWQAHQSQGEDFRLDEQALAKALGEHEGECFLLICQQNQVAHYERLSTQEFNWMTDIKQGLSLAELMDRHPDFDFINWLSRAIREGILEGLS